MQNISMIRIWMIIGRFHAEIFDELIETSDPQRSNLRGPLQLSRTPIQKTINLTTSLKPKKINEITKK
jgi:hypothetical protein